MTRWKRSLNLSARSGRRRISFLCLAGAALLLAGGCGFRQPLSRREMLSLLPQLCEHRYQAQVRCKEVGDTLWIYLAYTPGRQGSANVREKASELYIDYAVASFNPYRTEDPAELRFLAQKVLKSARELLLRLDKPYKFFILALTDIQNKNVSVGYDQLYIAYAEDARRHGVAKDFSGEAYSRLVWAQEKIDAPEDPLGNKVLKSYQDKDGEHLHYRDMTTREFVQKQIEWRIYKRFTIEYNTVPFDLQPQEKRAEILNIAQAVLKAYNFKDFETFSLGDGSFLTGAGIYVTISRKELEERSLPGITRKPAF
ncbi:MAG TPA: hypothetical protein VMD52_01145 [Patescibacteria group bacterium]|nr:hypothetical protein [Patescibacteria group bacterium]